MIRFVRFAFLALAAPSVVALPADAPPKARTVNAADHAFGLTLPDPYRWMEGQDNAEFDRWLKTQGAYARSRLDALPGLAAWQRKLSGIASAARINRALKPAGGRLFFVRVEGARDAGALMVREADGAERMLFDPATPADGKTPGEGPASIAAYSPSPDGRLVAVNLDRGGSEITRVQVLDVATATWLPDAVEPVWGEFIANWLPDGSGFSYTQLAPAGERVKGDPLQNMRVRLHRLGTPADQDPLLLKPGSNPSLPLASRELPEIEFPAGSNWALADIGGATPEIRFYAAPRAEALKPNATWRPIAGYADNVQGGSLRGDTLYLVSMKDHPHGRLLALDLSRPGTALTGAREILPEAADAMLAGINPTDGASPALVNARDAVYLVRTAMSGLDTPLRIDPVTGKPSPVATPFPGTIDGIAADPAADGFVFRLQGWTEPVHAYRYEPAAAARDIHLGSGVPMDYRDLTSTETEAVSADGTRVPLSIIHRKDSRRDGSELALVTGYGGYGISLQPGFNPVHLAWAEAGHVFAVCHVRGGGEKGDAWHRAGQGPDKHKGVEDYLACAAELAKRRYTTPARTGLFGASAGGLINGGALAAAPDRIGAVVIQAGFLNPVRLLAQPNGANQIAEVGDPRTEAGLKALAAMDPYQNVKDGIAYPALLLAVGLNDNRVAPWESGKFAARVQAATTSGKPVWIRTDADAGHFAGGGQLAGFAAVYADIYAFLEAQLASRDRKQRP